MSGHSKWRFAFWPVLAFACVLPALLALGFWQVQRGAEKQALFDAFERAAARTPRDATGLPLQDFEALPRYERVSLRGRYLQEARFLLDNMPRDGRPGHHVLNAFVPDGADYVVIVDRGWRPGIAAGAEDANIGEANEVTGMLAPLPRPALMLKTAPMTQGWPRIVQFPSHEDFSAMLARRVAEPRLLLDENAADGFVREWSAPGMPPARHYAYAFQWFGLALTLSVIFILMARPRRAEESEQ